MGVLIIRALQVGVCIRAPDSPTSAQQLDKHTGLQEAYERGCSSPCTPSQQQVSYAKGMPMVVCVT